MIIPTEDWALMMPKGDCLTAGVYDIDTVKGGASGLDLHLANSFIDIGFRWKG